jgi:3-oxoadipate enol-lactonase
MNESVAAEQIAIGSAGVALELGFARTRDNIQIAFRRTPGIAGGNWPRIVLIHSLALDASVWDEVLPKLAEHAEVLALDCRGHGSSQRAPGPYSVETFADDLADLLDALGWPGAIVAGCSMGGCVAQAFAGKYPARVQGLVLIDTTAWYGPDAPTEWRKRAATAQNDGLAALAAFQATRWFGDAFRAERPERLKAAMDVFLANDLACYAATCAMLGDADLRPYLAQFKVPVAVIVGEEDYATPIAAAQNLKEMIPGASLTILPKARHLTPIECPDIIAGEIQALVERVRLS